MCNDRRLLRDTIKTADTNVLLIYLLVYAIVVIGFVRGLTE